MHSKEQLEEMQRLPLHRKIQITTARIIEWYQHYNGMVYVAFSGGKDSTVLLDIARRIYPDIPAVFSDTGLEFPEVRDFVKSLPNITIVRPEMNFRKVIETYGYPVVSKRVADTVEYGHKPGSFRWRELHGEIKRSNGTPSEFNCEKGTHYGYGWCGGLCRWGTSEKLRAIKQFKNSLAEPVIDYVGIAADEANRFEKSAQEGKVLPLVEWGMSEHDCLQYCHAHGFYWIERATNAGTAYVDLYQLLDRVSCWCCCNKNLKELRNIYSYLPQYWDRLKILQQQIDRPFKGYYKGRPNGIFELEKRFLQEQL